MSKVYLEDSVLTDIADAIREKTGESEPITPANMPSEIEGISGGGEDIPSEIIFNDFQYVDYYGHYTWFFENENIMNKTKIIVKDPYTFLNAFGSDVNIKDLSNLTIYITKKDKFPSNKTIEGASIFQNCYSLIKTPKIDVSDYLDTISSIYVTFLSYNYMFSNCYKITTEQVNNFLDFPKNTTSDNFRVSPGPSWINTFSNCYNLRTLPNIFTNGWGYSRLDPAPGNKMNLFFNCISLDAIENFEDDFILSISARSVAQHFSNMVYYCGRLKEFTFKTNNGVPYIAKWSQATLDLSTVGYFINESSIQQLLTYTSIGNDKKVTDAASYEALKNDPDWWTEDVAYSRYNHDSAVRTINSLPDFSSGSNNSIKFKGNAGSLTDGGAINTLTEAEIAVASDKGWTVALT